MELFKLQNNVLQGDLLLREESMIIKWMPNCSAYNKRKKNQLNLAIPPFM